jgi:DNA end-binding protein Ku
MRLLSPDGMPLQRRYECPVEHRDIPWTELVRGYQIDEDHYVVLADDELEAIAPRKSRDIDLRLFAPAKSLDPFLFERPYVLTPGGDSTKPYRLLADAMEREDKAGIATFVMRTKEYLVAILARKGILWAETLRFAGELRSPKDVGLPANKKVAAKDRVAAFSSAIRSLAKSDIDRDELIDRRQSQLQTLVENKVRRGEGVVEVSGKQADAAAAPSADKPEEADLFAQIRRSLRMVGRANASNHAGGRRKGA